MLGFHANYVEECERFLSEESYIIDSKTDTEYLGRGMYFWEHQCKAEWWAKTHKRNSASMTVSAELSLENVLDLTDDDICFQLQKMYQFINKSIVRKIARERKCSDSNRAMGIILDEAFNQQMEQYDIVKAVKSCDKSGSCNLISLRKGSNFLYNNKCWFFNNYYAINKCKCGCTDNRNKNY